MSGSTFGELFRVTNFGESHGPAIGCVIDGCPPGMALSEADIQGDLDRRRPGTSRHVTQRNEADTVEILSGVYEGQTTGTPIALLIRNTDQRSKDYGNILDTFRPGHADYSYWQKYGLRDPRGGGRASARLTAPTVAAGAVAKKWLNEKHGTRFVGWMTQIGDVMIPFEDEAQIPLNPFFAPNAAIVPELEAYMDALRRCGDSCGARLMVTARGVPVGLGEPLYDKLDADIAYAMMGINAVKGVEIGSGFGVVTQKGSEHGDELSPQGFRSNHAGGVLGGISTGQDLVVSHRRQADQLDPHPARFDRPRRPADAGGNLRPPRPLRRHPRHADCRGTAGAGADGPCAAPPRTVRRRAAAAAADCRLGRRMSATGRSQALIPERAARRVVQ